MEISISTYNIVLSTNESIVVMATRVRQHWKRNLQQYKQMVVNVVAMSEKEQ